MNSHTAVWNERYIHNMRDPSVRAMIRIPSFTLSDNETKVREALVAPLLRALGYTDEEIQEEFPVGFRDKMPLRADYVVSVDHRYSLPPNRLVVEVKRPNHALSDPEILEQARLYASHRRVQATYIILVNGLDLDVYETSGLMPNLVRNFKVSCLHEDLSELSDILGPESLGSRFAGLHIIESVGSGGYGRVYKVRNERLGRVEALKVLHPGAEQTTNLVRRFEKGAKGLAVFDHPYICKVHDIGVYRERPFYRMEFVEGVSVTQYVTGNNLPFDERLQLFQKICEALSHAHEKGVVHCDLKPANVLVLSDDTPKLIDFDFCHLGSESSTTLSQIVATIAYMDPTIWETPQNRDVLADVYSTGLLLWSIITGKDLTPSWRPHSLLDELSSIGSEAETVGHVLLACLQENRSARPQNVREIIKLLGIKDWHQSLQGKLIGAVSNNTTISPARAFEFHFRYWQQTNSLPVSTDFERISKNIPHRLLSNAEKDFIFRAACVHWSTKYRSLFKEWVTDDLLKCAQAVLHDPVISESHKGKIAETSPARKAIELLTATDEYRDRHASEHVATFLLELLHKDKFKSLFFTTLDDVTRLKCFKPRNSLFREETSRILMEMIRSRLPKAGPDSARQIRKLLGKLDPTRCGADSEEVAQFLRNMARQTLFFEHSVKILALLETPHATDAFIDILEELRETGDFERIASIAIGIGGRFKRPAIAKYLTESSVEISSEKLRIAIKELLKDAP
jgi:serine/threonine protein kinase